MAKQPTPHQRLRRSFSAIIRSHSRPDDKRVLCEDCQNTNISALFQLKPGVPHTCYRPGVLLTTSDAVERSGLWDLKKIMANVDCPFCVFLEAKLSERYKILLYYYLTREKKQSPFIKFLKAPHIAVFGLLIDCFVNLDHLKGIGTFFDATVSLNRGAAISSKVVIRGLRVDDEFGEVRAIEDSAKRGIHGHILPVGIPTRIDEENDSYARIIEPLLPTDLVHSWLERFSSVYGTNCYPKVANTVPKFMLLDLVGNKVVEVQGPVPSYITLSYV